MEIETSENYIDEVLNLPERLYLRDKDLGTLLILDRHIIQVNIIKNQCLHDTITGIVLFQFLVFPKSLS